MRNLTADEEERAVRLQREALVVDTLQDSVGPEFSVHTREIRDRIDELAAIGAEPATIAVELSELAHRALVRDELPSFWGAWDEAGIDVVSVTVGAFGDRPFTYENAVRDLGQWSEKFDKLGDRLVKVTKAADARRAKAAGKRGVILNFQNTTHFHDDLDRLDWFYRMGLRIILLTYNSRNLVGDGCTERNAGGLSKFGITVVRRLNELGVLVDLAHCSEATALDAIEVSEQPPAVTHSFAKSVHLHDRGKSDDVIRAIGQAGGYFGVCTVPFFLTSEPNPSLDHFLHHLNRTIELAGIDHVGIGTDWGPELPRTLIAQLNEELRRFGLDPAVHGADYGATTDGFRSWREWPNITRALVGEGFDDKEIYGLLGGNFLRLFERTVG